MSQNHIIAQTCVYVNSEYFLLVKYVLITCWSKCSHAKLSKNGCILKRGQEVFKMIKCERQQICISLHKKCSLLHSKCDNVINVITPLIKEAFLKLEVFSVFIIYTAISIIIKKSKTCKKCLANTCINKL